MTDIPDDEDAPASEALAEARARKSATKNQKIVAGAIATGIGSAALVAALMYTNRNKKKNPK
jgi:hypothetical protein